jgi:hypothetical protein
MNDAVLNTKTDAHTSTKAHHAAAAALTPGKGLLVLLGVVVMIGAFIALNHALGIADFWVAFLFLLYWSSVEQMSFAKLPSCIVGALVGLLMGYLLQTLPVVMGPIGGLVFLVAILVLIYCQLMGWFPIAVNMMTMLFLTVVTIPTVQATANFLTLLAALGLGLAYFVGLLAFSNFLKQRMAKR